MTLTKFGHEYYVLWSVPICVSLDRSILCMRCGCLYDIEAKQGFIHFILNRSDPLQVSVLTRTQPMQVSAWTLTWVTWSRLQHCNLVFHSLLTFTYECAGDQEQKQMHGFVFSLCTKIQVWLTLTWPWLCWPINYTSNKSVLTSIRNS